MGCQSNCGSGKTERIRVQLRPFTFQDLDRVLEIEGRSFEVQAFSKSQFEEIYGDHPEAFYVAESFVTSTLPPPRGRERPACHCEARAGRAGGYFQSGGVVGYILGTIAGETGELRSLAVDPNFRNLGVGRRLVEWLLKRFREMGIRVSSLKVRTDNEPAIRLYKKIGFKIVKTLASKGKGDVEAYLMKINI